MAFKVKFSVAALFSPVKRLLQKATFWGLPVLALVLAVLLWHSGGREAEHAFNDGRRLLITVNGGVITGKQATPETIKEMAKAAAEKLAAEKKAAEEKDKAAKEAEAKAAKEAEKTKTEASKPEEPKPEEPAKEVKQEEKATEKKEAPVSVVPSASPVASMKASLSEKSDVGLLPVIGSDGTMPWQYYSKGEVYKGSAPVVAIIVTGLGVGRQVTDSAIKLPENITLSFSPYAQNVESWATAARVTGHEILMDLPLQPAEYPLSDPGPYGLLVAKEQSENEKKLKWLLSRFGAYTGLLTPQSEAFIGDKDSFAMLLDALGKRGLMLVLGREVVKEDTKKQLEAMKTPVITADVLLDEEINVSAIQARIATLEQMARDKGYAVGIAQAYPVTIEQLGQLKDRFNKEGVVLVPLSHIARKISKE